MSTEPTIGPLDDAERLALAAARLLAVDDAPYLASALFSLTPLAAPGLGTMAVDRYWRLYIDPDCLDRWTASQQAAVLTHEIGHLIRGHAERADAACADDKLAWNYAADAEINDDLLDAGADLPPGCVTPESIGCAPGDFAEVYYQALMAQGQAATGAGCGSGAGGPGQSWELGEASGDAATGGLDPADAELVRRKAAIAVAEASGRGTMPGGWARWAAGVLAPPVLPWRRLLGGAVRHALTCGGGGEHPTYRRPGRRRIPGVLTPAMRRPLPNLALVVDTSGSMSAADLDAAMSEVAGIAAAAGVRGTSLRLLSVDATTHSVTPVKRVADVVLSGGGGTDMRVGIAAAAALHPRPDAIVVLTDGDTPWPERPTTPRLVCAVISNHPPVGTPPWAATVHIPARR